MKNQFISRLFLAALLVFSFAFAVSAQDAKQTKPVVMILGSYHMGNPNRDLNNVKADDILTEKRQKEIADFIQILKKFKPTRIAVEVKPDDAKIAENYVKYLKGEYDLQANEVDQIAFRLAKELNQPKVFQIDWKHKFDFGKVLASAKANGQMPIAEATLTFGKKEAAKQSEMLKTTSVTDLFRYLNEEDRVNEWHRYYLNLVRVGKDSDYAGTDLVGDWYLRNLRIYANLTRINDSPSDRILVLYGAGHAKLLQHYVEQSGEFDLERLGKYL